MQTPLDLKLDKADMSQLLSILAISNVCFNVLCLLFAVVYSVDSIGCSSSLLLNMRLWCQYVAIYYCSRLMIVIRQVRRFCTDR